MTPYVSYLRNYKACKPRRTQSWFSPSCEISYIRRYFEGHSQQCDTQTTLVLSFFVGSCRRKKMLHSWYSAVTMKDGQNAHNASGKQVTVSAEPLAQLSWSYSVRVYSFAHLVLSMAASSAWRTCLPFRVAWRWGHTRPQTHVVIIWLDLHLG
jgi:hypothetical protein